MGTMLYARGVFINRCYDELNISQPELVRAIHEEYVQAGAEIIETNTFGSNSFRLGRYGLQDQVRAINLAGVGLAREAVRPVNEKQSARILVAGSIGPLGAQMGPSGGPPKDAVRVAFAEQIAALDEGGVDLLMVETLTSLGEAHQAILAARETAPHLPLVVMVTVDEGGNCLDGHTPEETARLLTEWGADVVGCNCSAGPHAVLAAVERMRTVTTLPLAAIPNAGVPRSVDGRNIYLCSPEYMASYARKFVQAGVQFVGGCCGTTPDHIRAMRSALRALEARGTRHMISTVETTAAAIQPPPLAERSSLGARLAAKEFLTLVEIVPPRGIACARELDAARLLAQSGVHAINVPDSPRASARQSPLGLCLQIQHQTAMETVLHVTCRDRNTLSIQSDLLGAASLGLHNVLCVTGDPPKLGNYPDATAVFDVDSIGLVSIVRNLNHGLDIGNNAIGASTGFTIGVAANPGVPDIDNEVRRFAAKVEAGAEYAITQPVFVPHSCDCRHLAAYQPAQCRVHAQGTGRQRAGCGDGTDAARGHAGAGARGRRPDCAGDAGCGTILGARCAGECASRPLRGCGGGVASGPRHGAFPRSRSTQQSVIHHRSNYCRQGREDWPALKRHSNNWKPSSASWKKATCRWKSPCAYLKRACACRMPARQTWSPPKARCRCCSSRRTAAERPSRSPKKTGKRPFHRRGAWIGAGKNVAHGRNCSPKIKVTLPS
jgi:homocysteine S-methyltransferase